MLDGKTGVKKICPCIYFLEKVALKGLTAAQGTFIMVSAFVIKKKKRHTENEVLAIMGGIIGWCS